MLPPVRLVEGAGSDGVRASERVSDLAGAGVIRLADLDLQAALRIARDGIAPAPSESGLDPTAWLQAVIDQLTALTMQDGLTGLFNRRYFDRRIEQEVLRSTRERRPCSVLIIDADDFKQVNDRHGHGAGDAVLCGLAARLHQVLRASDDVTSRLGGEEFAVVLPGTDAPGGARAGERVCHAVAEAPIPADGVALRVTVSVGVATFDADAPCSARELVERADAALYRAKSAGKNCVRAHEDDGRKHDGSVTAAERKGLLR